MLFALLTLVCCAFVTALPGEHGPEKWGEPKGGNGNGNKIINGGDGGGIDIGIGGGGGGGGGCDPVACDIKCRKLGDQSGYCDDSDRSTGLLGLDILGQTMPHDHDHDHGHNHNHRYCLPYCRMLLLHPTNSTG
ncbi:hypothetical protein N7532_002205 [Penicillium argentinense]|uniref:Hydrophobin n=1 Tax=Penicillium argentinense TaxID=1131581 RepID=A0A9W9KKD7_9EURO|nr:uncharacterized protein N7532_002205 [Penicillium argentinense]KAJ5109560.1 hypothetical protein N7532_002205 [Penicillium argentinense]